MEDMFKQGRIELERLLSDPSLQPFRDMARKKAEQDYIQKNLEDDLKRREKMQPDIDKWLNQRKFEKDYGLSDLKPKQQPETNFMDNVLGFLKGDKTVNRFSMEDTDPTKQTSYNAVGKVLPGENPNEFDRFLARTTNTMGLNTRQALSSLEGDQRTLDGLYNNRQFGQGGGTDLIADMLGYVGPGAVAAKGLRSIGLGANIGKGATTAQKGLQYGKEGALVGLGMGVAETPAMTAINPEQGALDHFKRIGLETLGGAVLDPAIMGVGGIIAKKFPNIFRKIEKGEQLTPQEQKFVQDEVLLLPEGRPELPEGMKATSTTRTEPRYKSPEPTKIDDVLSLPEGAKTKTDARGLGNEYYSKRLEDFFEFARKQELTPGREREVLEDLWSGFANKNEDFNLDTLVDLANPTLDQVKKYGTKPKTSESPLQFKRERYNPLDELTEVKEPKPFTAQNQQMTKTKIEGDLNVANVGDKVKLKANKGEYKVVGQDKMTYTIVSDKGRKVKIDKNIVDQVINQSEPKVNVESTVLGGKAQKQTPIQTQTKPKNIDPDATFQYQKESTIKSKDKMDVRAKAVDDLAPVQRAESTLNQVKGYVEGKAYQLQRLVRGGASAAHTDIKTKLNPILKAMKKDGVESESVMSYALAKRADWLVKNKGYDYTDFGELNNEQTVKNTLDKFGNDSKVTKHYEQVRKYLDGLVDDMYKAGLINKDTANYFKNSEYIPTGRERTEDGFERAFTDILPAEYRKAIRELDGGSETSAIKNPLEQMVIHTFNVRQTIFKNIANQELLKLARKDADGKFLKEIKKPNKASNAANVIKVYEDGKEILLDAHKDIAEAIKGANITDTNILTNITRFTRTMNTTTPNFLLRSVVREIPYAYTVSNAKFSLTKDLPMAMLDLVSNGKLLGDKSLLDKYYSSGAGQNTIYAMDRDISAKTMLKAMQGKDEYSKKMLTIANPKHLFEALRIFADVTEQIPKLAEYRATLRKGTKGKNWLKEAGIPNEILQKAAYNARDIMDYSRSGSSTRQMNRYVAFLNSAVQGKSKVYRSFRNNPTGTFLRGVTSLTMPTAAMFYLRKEFASEEQETAIQEAPDWLRHTFFLLPIPGDEENRLIRIPKPFDLSPIFATSVERGLEHMYGVNEQTTLDGIKEFTKQMVDLPREFTALTAMYEIPANYDYFLDRDIVPQSMTGDDTKKIEQDNVYTSSTARFIASMVNGFGGEETWAASPMMMDHALRKVTGSMGGEVMDFVDVLVGDKRNPKPKNSEPTLNPISNTFGKAFSVKTEGKSSSKVNDVYDVQAKLKRSKSKYEEEGKEFPYASVYTYVNKTQKELSRLATQIREIENNPDYTAEQKQSARNKLSTQRNTIAREFSEKFKNMRSLDN